MQRRSPLPLAHQVQGPVSLMHGVHDPLVSVSQTVRMAEALRLLSKPAELVLILVPLAGMASACALSDFIVDESAQRCTKPSSRSTCPCRVRVLIPALFEGKGHA